MRKTVTLTLNEDLEVTFGGLYTPYDAGVMYHKDMSGTPPTSAEFEIDTMDINAGTIVDLIDYVENQISSQLSLIKDKLKEAKPFSITLESIWEHLQEKCIGEIEAN